VEGEATVNAVKETGMRFLAELRLLPGLYSLRVLIRNHATQTFFLARRDLEVPGAHSSGPQLLPPLIPESPPVPVIVGQHAPDRPSRLSALPGLETWPAARPVIDNHRQVDLVLVCSPIDESLAVSTRLVNSVGRTVDEPRLEVTQPVSSLGAVAFHRATLSPVDVPTGHYRLVVELSDTDSGQTVSRSLEIAVGSDDGFSKWAEREAAAPPMPSTEKGGKKLHPRLIKMAYDEALRLLADGAPVEARRTLAELERQIVATGSPRQWMRLREIEWDTAIGLSRSYPASLMAVALLHREMYHWYAARYEFELSEHSWTLAAAIAEQTSRSGPRDYPENFVEALLLDLATDLARRGSVRRAQTLFERAFEIAPRDEAVLFGLALVHEFAGESYQAVEYLQRLVEDHPDHYEARLRLAINHGRLGAEGKAEKLLRALLEEPAPAWIQAITYQELTRLLLEEDRIGQTELLLREAIERLPSNQRLRIQLAYVLDRSQRPWDAAAIIEQAEAGGVQLSTSPRVRYAEWPIFHTEKIRATLGAAESAGLEALAEAYQ
jgi:tetratricopeptide (TPR) repeat protein